MRRYARSGVAAVALCAVAAGFAHGQTDGRPGTVAGSGTVVINRLPEALRVEIALFGSGEDIDESLASLKARSESVRKRLVELGASKDSIKLGATEFTSVKPGRLQQVELVAARRRGKRVKKPEEATVTASVTSDFPLDAKDGEALLRAVPPLKKKIREADLAGVKEMEPLTPEQEELLVQAEAEGRFDPDGEKPGDPTFQFVSRLTEKDRDTAIAEALRKAKGEAATLAKATGGELGRIQSVFMTDSGEDEMDTELSFLGALADNVVAMHMVQTTRVLKGAAPDGREAIRKEAASTRFHITVTASFELKSK